MTALIMSSGAEIEVDAAWEDVRDLVQKGLRDGRFFRLGLSDGRFVCINPRLVATIEPR